MFSFKNKMCFLVGGEGFLNKVYLEGIGWHGSLEVFAGTFNLDFTVMPSEACNMQHCIQISLFVK